LIFHLRMSGDLVLRPIETPPAPHDRLILYLSGGLQLAFNDTRKFGRVWYTSQPDDLFSRLGPEPLDPNLSSQEFHQRLLAHRRQLKPLLLDQSFLAGVGNIYSDEALHLARLHPLALSHTLTEEQSERLLTSLRHVLSEGIRLEGASIDWVYRGGGFQNQFRVYGRAGDPCPQCSQPIVRIVVGQRSTHICPVCQPGP
jgi:formamidopyrimidine-DNA glycosylase